MHIIMICLSILCSISLDHEHTISNVFRECCLHSIYIILMFACYASKIKLERLQFNATFKIVYYSGHAPLKFNTFIFANTTLCKHELETSIHIE